MVNIAHRVIWEIAGRIIHMMNCISFPIQKDSGQIVRFNTSACTDNLGDYIIMYYCRDVLEELYEEREYIDVPTHVELSQDEEDKVKYTKYKFVCGTNLLTSHIEQWWNWRLPDGLRRKLNYKNVILLGVGWKNYEDDCSDYSKMIYRSLLNPNVLHSVRDSYTEKMLRQAGIKNVINTGCPTMWRLTPQFCKNIPTKKARNVITTVTDYRPNIKYDNQMLEILSKNYEKVYLWIQGSTDESYLKQLSLPRNLELIPASLDAYENQLNKREVDYIGTRLHAGIFALNHQIRSIIIAVDNRAIEIAKDTNLPIIFRKQIKEELESRIQCNWPTQIKIKQDNIDLFKSQFR